MMHTCKVCGRKYRVEPCHWCMHGKSEIQHPRAICGTQKRLQELADKRKIKARKVGMQ